MVIKILLTVATIMNASSIFGDLTTMNRVYNRTATKLSARKWNVAMIPMIRGRFVSASCAGVRVGNGGVPDMMVHRNLVLPVAGKRRVVERKSSLPGRRNDGRNRATIVRSTGEQGFIWRLIRKHHPEL
jgi:hypothetical protein